jgi:hypothetical protein
VELQELQARAIAKAIGAGLPAKVTRVGRGHYEVPSSSQPGVVYTVRRTRGPDGAAAVACTCPSGYRPACLHKASVYVWWLQRRGLIVKPKPVPKVAKPKRRRRLEVALT